MGKHQWKEGVCDKCHNPPVEYKDEVGVTCWWFVVPVGHSPVYLLSSGRTVFKNCRTRSNAFREVNPDTGDVDEYWCQKCLYDWVDNQEFLYG